MSIKGLSPARLKVEGERKAATKAWSFRNVYGSLMGLGDRVENFSLTDELGARVAVRKLASGEYESEGVAKRFSYEVNLGAQPFPSDLAHASWLTAERGFLMLGDLLPLPTAQEGGGAGALVKVDVPESWTIATTETRVGGGDFQVSNLENAVFFVGQNLREKSREVGGLSFTLAVAGDWAFSDDEALGMGADILREHLATAGKSPGSHAMLMLAPFPQRLGAERWAAETRGDTVMLIAGQSPSKVAALAQLSVPLTHELFHLWVPNALSFDGDYGWFYEGFTLYQALRAGVKLQYLTFQDYLNALGRAFDIYQSANERDRFSLLEASRRRWTGANSLVYQKALIVAFLYDLTLRQSSAGKRTIEDVYRSLFSYGPPATGRREGNDAVLSALSGQSGMQDFARRYVESAGAIDLSSAVAPFGLTVQRYGAITKVTVAGSLTRSQRDLLRKLGYNDRSRAGHS